MYKIWFDIDFGFDDWLVMLMLLVNLEVNWLGVLVVVGNVLLVIIYDNVLCIKQYYQLDVFVYVGCEWLFVGVVEIV